MSLATLARRMADSGASADLIAIVMEEVEALQLSLDARRAADRERKRAQREREKSADITGQSEDSHSHVTDIPSPQSPPLKSTPDPEKITPPLTPQPLGCARPKFPAPEGVGADQWKAFRQQRKKPLNERAYVLLCNKLKELAEAGWPPGEMIDRAIERGWETVFEPKDHSNGRSQASVGRMGGPKPDPTLELLRAARAAQRPVDRDYDQARLALPAR